MVRVADICPWSPQAPCPLLATALVFVWGYAPPTLKYREALGGPPLRLPHTKFGDFGQSQTFPVHNDWCKLGR